MIPGMALAKVGGLLAKGSRLTKGIGKLRRALTGIDKVDDASKLSKFSIAINKPLNVEKWNLGIENLGTASVMRIAENYQEARQTYEPVYKEAAEKLGEMDDKEYAAWVSKHADLFEESGIKPDDKDGIAKYIAKRAADRTFREDGINIFFDLLQLQGLRSIGKLKNNITSRTVKQELRNQIAAAGSSGEQVIKSNKWRTGFQWLADQASGTGKIALEESTEGIEEAINFIAQQEGITFGKSIIGNMIDENGKPISNNTATRLWNYVNDPQLWDAAFWGALGGLVFGAGGSYYNTYRRAKDAANRQKLMRQLNNDKNQEADTKEVDWFLNSELPEIKSARENIRTWNAKLNQFNEDKKAIERGENPFKEDPTPITSEQERETAIKNLKASFRANIALGALHSGTYNHLRTYLTDSNVKKAMVELGLAEEGSVDAFVDETLQTMDRVAEIYDRQITHVSNQLAYINASRDNNLQVPQELTALIAQDNVAAQLNIDELDKQIESTTKEAQEEARQTNLPQGINYQDIIRFVEASTRFSELDADIRAYQEDETLNPIQRESLIRNAKDQQSKLLRYVLRPNGETVNGNNFAYVLQMLRWRDGYIKRGENNYVQNNESQLSDLSIDEVKELDKKLIKDFEEIDSLLKENKVSYESLTTQANAVADLIAKKDILKQLEDSNSKLNELYHNLINLEYQRRSFKENIAETRTQILNKVDEYNNLLNTARANALDLAFKTITNIFKKYKDTNLDGISEAIVEEYNNNRSRAMELATKYLEESEVKEFIDALDVMHLSKATNEALYRTVTDWINKLKENSFNESANIAEDDEVKATEEVMGTPPVEDIADSSTDDKTEPIEEIPSNTSLNIVLNNKTGKLVGVRTPANQKQFSGKNSRGLKVNNVQTISDGNGTHELLLDRLSSTQLPKYLTEDFFEPADNEMEITNPDMVVRVTSNPILHLREDGTIASIDKGTYEIVPKSGEPVAINTAESESVEPEVEPEVEQEDEYEISSNVETVETEEVPKGLESVDDEDDTFSLRGDTSRPTPSSESTDSIALSNDSNDDELQLEIYDIMEPILNEALDNGTFNMDTLETARQAVYSAARGDNDVLSQFTNKAIVDATNDLISRIITPQHTNIEKDSTDEAAEDAIRASKILERSTDSPTNVFDVALEAFIKEFNSRLILDKVDGKYVIDIRTIKEYLNNSPQIGDDISKKLFLRVIKQYIETNPEAKAKYIIIDSTKNVPESQVTADETGAVGNQIPVQVDFDLAFDKAMNDPTETTKPEEISKALDELKEGDLLNAKVVQRPIYRNGEYTDRNKVPAIELRTKEGILIGMMPFPQRVEDGTYYAYKNALCYDLKIGDNGIIESKSGDFIKKVFLSNEDDYKAIRECVLSYIATNSIANNIAKLQLNETLTQLISQSIKDYNYARANHLPFFNFLYVETENREPKVNLKKLIQGLASIYNGIDFEGAYTEDRITLAITNSINNYLRRLYDSTQPIWFNGTTGQEIAPIKVGFINDGELITITTNPAKDYDKMPICNDSSVADVNAARLTIVKRRGDKYFFSSSEVGEQPCDDSLPNGATGLILTNARSHTPMFVAAYGLKLSDFGATDTGKQLYTALHYHIADILYRAFATNAETNQSFEIIKSMLERVVQLKGKNNVALLRGSAGNTFDLIEFSETVKDKVCKGIELRCRYKAADGRMRFKTCRFYNKTGFGNQLAYRFSTPVDGKYPLRSKSQSKKEAFQRNQILVKDILDDLMGFLRERASFNIDAKGIDGDTNKTSNFDSNSFFSRDSDGKVIVTINNAINQMFPGEPATPYQAKFDSYNDFFTKNNILRVNTKLSPQGRNFNSVARKQTHNQVLYVNMETGVNQKEIPEPQESILDRMAPGSRRFGFEEAYSIITSDASDKAYQLLQLALGEDAEALKDLDLIKAIFPKAIKFQPNLNANEEIDTDIADVYTGTERYKSKPVKSGANVTRKRGEVNVGWKFLNLLASTNVNDRNAAIRKLIHEQLHVYLARNPEFTKAEILDALKPVLEEFRSYYSSEFKTLVENFNKNSGTGKNFYNAEPHEVVRFILNNYHDDAKAYALQWLYRYQNNTARSIEEFLVESITSPSFQSALNSIRVEDVGKEGPKTLFDKIIDFIVKFFNGFKAADNSLLKKELNILSNVIGNKELNEISPVEESVDNVDTTEQDKKAVDENSTEDDILENELDDIFKASIVETNNEVRTSDGIDGTYNTVDAEDMTEVIPIPFTPQLSALKDSLPIAIQPKFDALVSKGAISYTCR